MRTIVICIALSMIIICLASMAHPLISKAVAGLNPPTEKVEVWGLK